MTAINTWRNRPVKGENIENKRSKLPWNYGNKYQEQTLLNVKADADGYFGMK